MSSYTVFPSEDGKYVVLQHRGEINSEVAMTSVQEAHRLGAELGITRYLVDLTEARNTDSISKTYQYAYKDAKPPPETIQNMRVSMLVSPEDHSHDFVETALRNAGHNVTLFRDPESAIEHLLK